MKRMTAICAAAMLVAGDAGEWTTPSRRSVLGHSPPSEPADLGPARQLRYPLTDLRQFDILQCGPG
jgi:hypothetical protein